MGVVGARLGVGVGVAEATGLGRSVLEGSSPEMDAESMVGEEDGEWPPVDP